MNTLVVDDISEFNTYAPSKLAQMMIALSHRKHNFLSNQIAQLVRRWIIATKQLPVDISVDGINLRCYLNDNCSEKKFAFMPSRYDQVERTFIKNHLPADGVFLDIGANIGIYSLTANQVLGSKGHIFAIEPNPDAVTRLSFNIACSLKADSPSIDIVEVGVSPRSEQKLFIDENNIGGSSIVNRGKHPKSIAIKCLSLLKIMDSHNIQRIDIMKIDIEGAEDDALIPFLDDANRSLFPKHIIIENSEHLWKAELPVILIQHGYQLHCKTSMNSIYTLQN